MKPEERYQLLEKVASGSFATVYRAQDLELGREVAVKQIHSQFLADARQLDRYWGEAQLLAALQHPNIVTIYDLVRERGWLIMELMQGNLGERLRGRPLDLVALRTVLAHSLRALKFLHEHGIVHGDIKPSNLLVDRRKRLKIGDFGLARRVSDDEGSLLKGTTRYMAPEVVSDEFGEVGPASDLYSLGFSAYELMCGAQFESLFPGLNSHGRDKQLAWIMWHAAADRRLPPISRVLEGVPEDLARVIERLSTKDQRLRYQSADDALRDLNVDLRVVRGDEVAVSSEGMDPARKRRLLVIGGFVASMGLSALILLMGNEQTPAPKVQSGLVREVRPQQNELVIVDEVTKIPEILSVGSKPSLLLSNTRQKILLEEVRPDDRIRVVAGKSGPEFILARPMETRGTILRMDGTKGLTIQTADVAKREEIPFGVDESTQISLNGEETTPLDLRELDRVDVRHLPLATDQNRRMALSIAARRTMHATGFVRTLNAEARKLTFDVRQGLTMKTLELPFSSDCVIQLPNGSTQEPDGLKADDLLTGDRVSVDYDVEIRDLKAVRNQSLAGVVMTIDEGQNSVGVQTRDGVQHSLRINAETEIDIGGELARFTDLRQYDEVRVTFHESDDGSGAVAYTLDATRPAKYDRFAIVVGVQNYEDRKVARPDHVLRDVQRIADVLRQRYCVASDRLLLFKDIDRERFQKEIGQALTNVLAQTQVLVFFEGQAYEADGKFYLACRDFKSDSAAESGVPLTWLTDALEGSAAQDKLLILDTHQVAPDTPVAEQPSPAKILSSVAAGLRTTHALAARSDGETGRVWLERGTGRFVWELTEGLKGAADTDRDLHLTGQELLDFLQPRLTDPTVSQSERQTPVLFSPKSGQ